MKKEHFRLVQSRMSPAKRVWSAFFFGGASAVALALAKSFHSTLVTEGNHHLLTGIYWLVFVAGGGAGLCVAAATGLLASQRKAGAQKQAKT